MQLNIAQKIFGIAAVVLVLMVAVAVYSIQLTASISKDLRAVAQQHLPASQAVGRINVKVLNQGVLLQRLFVLSAEDGTESKTLSTDKQLYKQMGADVAAAFEQTRALLNRDDYTDMARQLGAIEREYQAFEAHGWKLVQAREANQKRDFDRLVAQLNPLQDAIDSEISNLHERMAAQTDRAVVKADQEERNLLAVNSVLTIIAALLALGFAAIVTRLLVRAVRDLAMGAKAVEDGDLDTHVSVTTHDEVGQLTNSFNTMVEGLRLKERIKDTFGKYMDPRIVENLLDHPEFTNPGGERREMTVLFIDLKGFTSISEVLAPDVLVEVVNDFFGRMTEAISRHKGVVDKYMGDAVMAYWGPPFCEPGEHALLACRAAADALKALDEFRASVHAMGDAAKDLDIDLRIGISTGDMIVGTIGSKAARNFTVMGDPVNLGSRLEGANKAYGTHVLMSQRTHDLVSDSIEAREIDIIRVKGKHEPVRVFELRNDQSTGTDFLPALQAYRTKDWDAAEQGFGAQPADTAARVYLERIKHLRSALLPADWDGVWVFETK